MDTTTEGALEGLTMNPLVLTTVAGDLATKWRRIAVVIIVQPVVATHLRVLTDPRLLPTRCRLFRRIRVLVARILVARDHIEVQAVYGKYIEYLFGKLLSSLNPYDSKLAYHHKDECTF
jgi:hypothetical protein